MKKKFCMLGVLLTTLNPMVYSTSYVDMDISQSVDQNLLTVKGRVLDKEGEPLIGVAIVEKSNKSNGTITDINGEYSLKTSPRATLVFTYVGYATKEEPVKNRSQINVVLGEDDILMNEVVVVGYSTKKKVTLSGSVGVVGKEAFESKPVSNVGSALQGVVPGLTVTRGGGQPGGEGFAFNIRGISSINGGNPLILVDGNAVNDLNMINPHDIESMSVLKDASASIYGSRASAGVILITTKKGSESKPVIKFSTNVTLSSPLNKVKYPNLFEYAHMSQEADMNNGVVPYWTDEKIDLIGKQDPIPYPNENNYQFFQTTDWFDELYGHGLQQDYNINVSGANKFANYYFSVGYNKNDGLIKNAPDKAERYNIRSNVTFNLRKNLKLITMLNFERFEVEEIQNLDRVVSAPSMTPIQFPVKTPSGKWFSQWGYTNPIAMAQNKTPYQKWTNRFSPTLKLEWEVLKGLKLIGHAGFTFESFDSKLVRRELPYYTYNDLLNYHEYQTMPDNATYAYSKNQQRNLQFLINYSTLIDKKHDINVVLGATHEESDYDYFDAYRENFISKELYSLNLGDTKNMRNNGFGNAWCLESFLGSLGYIYDNKYIVDFNFRYDGSSKFSKDNRWKLFLGGSAAWRISEEKFIKDNTDFFDNLKLRLSYGEMGNQAGIGLYDYVQNVGVSGAYPFGNVQKAQSAYLLGMASQNRTWETLATTNIGLDMTILDNRLDVSFDYFWKRNKNMLIGVTYPSVLGSNPPTSNNGELKSWGWELNVGWKDKIKDFNYGVNFVLSDNNNKIIDLGGYDSYNLGHVAFREGHTINEYYGYDFMGIIQNEQQLNEYKQLKGVPGNIGIGDAMYRDVDGNGRIDAYSKEAENGDLIILGNTNPRLSFGVNLNASYKGFDFSAFFQGVGKRTLFRDGNARIPFFWSWYHPARMYYNNTWSEDRTDAKYPKLSHSDIRWWNFEHSSNSKVNSAYVRLKNITLGYTLPKKIVEATKYFSNVRLYVTGTDLFSIHSLKGGFDPEDTSNGTGYPLSKTVTFGLDVTF